MSSATPCSPSVTRLRRSSAIGGRWRFARTIRRRTTTSAAPFAPWGAWRKRRPSWRARSRCGPGMPRRWPISAWCCRSAPDTARRWRCTTGRSPPIRRTRRREATGRCCCCCSAGCARASPSTSGAGGCRASRRRSATSHSRCGMAATSRERTLFIHAEQGLGSAIQFVRYADLLAARGNRVVIECRRPLHRLFAHSLAGAGGIVTVIRKGESLPTFDCHAPLMSLPHLLGTTMRQHPRRGSIPQRPRPRISWLGGERLASAPRPRIGLVWAGNPKHENDHNRSMPAAAAGAADSKRAARRSSACRFRPTRRIWRRCRQAK